MSTQTVSNSLQNVWAFSLPQYTITQVNCQRSLSEKNYGNHHSMYLPWCCYLFFCYRHHALLPSRQFCAALVPWLYPQASKVIIIIVATITLKLFILMNINKPHSVTTSPTISPDLQRKAATIMLMVFSPVLS